MDASFPTQLSEIYFNDATTTPTLYGTLKHLKRTTLSLPNRLRSIIADATYVSEVVHSRFPDFPLIANERCGSWYIPPHLKKEGGAGSAYFKSTDGHYGAWDFSLRRLNLQLLDVLGRNGGAVMVDSTRRGKRMPDALRRTVPVWVVVLNRVLFGCDDGNDDDDDDDDDENNNKKQKERWDWAFKLQHPGLEPGEVRLIEANVPRWMAGFKSLGLDIRALKRQLGRPIRLAWIVQGEEHEEISLPPPPPPPPPPPSSSSPSTSSSARTVVDNPTATAATNEHNHDHDHNLLVLCSASRRVLGAEMSEDGYVQGAADDAEGWSGGLTADVFWQGKDALLAAREEELPELMARLIEEAKGGKSGGRGRAQGPVVDLVRIEPTPDVFVAAAAAAADATADAGSTSTATATTATIAATADATRSGQGSTAMAVVPATNVGDGGSIINIDSNGVGLSTFGLIVACNDRLALASPRTIHLGCRPGKLGSRDLREKLPAVVERVSDLWRSEPHSKILVACENGRDLSVGVAVTLLCLFYDDRGQRITSRPRSIDKQLVKRRLAWITMVKPSANPSRSTLQAVNSFLMGQPP